MGNKLRTQIVDKSEKLTKLVRVTSHSSHMKHDLIYGLHGYSRFSRCRIFRFVPFRSGLSLFPIGERARISSHHRKVAILLAFHSCALLYPFNRLWDRLSPAQSVKQGETNDYSLPSIVLFFYPTHSKLHFSSGQFLPFFLTSLLFYSFTFFPFTLLLKYSLLIKLMSSMIKSIKNIIRCTTYILCSLYKCWDSCEIVRNIIENCEKFLQLEI